jgi:hypothetical protein
MLLRCPSLILLRFFRPSRYPIHPSRSPPLSLSLYIYIYIYVCVCVCVCVCVYKTHAN